MSASKMTAFGGDDSMLKQFMNLPKEIFVYLFSKLDVCSIIRCRSVCKHWLHLLSHPKFVKLHHNHSQTRKKLLIPPGFGSPCILEEGEEFHTSRVNLPLEGEGISYSAKILGSCKGLICILMRNNLKMETDGPHYTNKEYKLLIWNPSTRDYKIIHDDNPLLNNLYEYFDYYTLVGLGFDSSCEDYKLVHACVNPQYKLETYSLKTSVWKVIKSDPPYTDFETCRFSCEGISVNGSFLYWIVMGEGERRFVRYELEKEKFRELQCLPTDINGFNLTAKLLKVMGGDNLGLSCNYIKGGGLDMCIKLWMMKEGDKEEWSKLWCISYGDIQPQLSLKCFMFYGPICHFENGAVLFYDTEVHGATGKGPVLMVVDPKLKKITGTIPVSGITNPCRLEIATYIETLVSPNASGSLSTAFE